MRAMLHVLILVVLGGVRLRDAVEAAAYERQRPAIRREDALDPVALMISRKVDEVSA